MGPPLRDEPFGSRRWEPSVSGRNSGEGSRLRARPWPTYKVEQESLTLNSLRMGMATSIRGDAPFSCGGCGSKCSPPAEKEGAVTPQCGSARPPAPRPPPATSLPRPPLGSSHPTRPPPPPSWAGGGVRMSQESRPQRSALRPVESHQRENTTADSHVGPVHTVFVRGQGPTHTRWGAGALGCPKLLLPLG